MYTLKGVSTPSRPRGQAGVTARPCPFSMKLVGEWALSWGLSSSRETVPRSGVSGRCSVRVGDRAYQRGMDRWLR